MGDWVSSGIMGTITLGLLGLLIIGLGLGILWGALRGTKRTLIRLVSLLVFCIIALFITPVISTALYNADIKIFGGQSIQEMVLGLLNDPTIDSALSAAPEIKSFLLEFPHVAVNLVVFILLLIVFKAISWIVYAVVAKFLAPKKDQSGNKVKRGWLLGMGFGFVQGLVLFFFFMIPINAVIHTINRIDTYYPSLAAVNIFNTGVPEIDELNKSIRDLNDGLVKSPYGFLTQYTGIQFLSDASFNYLVTVPLESSSVKSVNLKEDVVTGFELIRDFVALKQLLEYDDLSWIMPAQYNAMRDIVNKIFDMDTVKLVLTVNVGDLTESLLEDFNLFDLLHSDEESEGGAETTAITAGSEEESFDRRFNEAVIKAIRSITTDFGGFLRTDCINAIDLMEILFSDHVASPTQRYNLYKAFSDVFSTFDDEEVFATNAEKLKETLNYKKDGDNQTLSQKFFGKIASFNIFSKVLGDPDNKELHSLLIARFLGIDESRAEIDDFDYVINGIGRIIIDFCDVAGDISTFMNAEDFDAIADLLNGTEGDRMVTSIAGILNELTNVSSEGKYGITRIVRATLASLFDAMIPEEEIISSNDLSIEDFTGSFVEVLKDSDTVIDWEMELNLLRKLIGLVGLEGDDVQGMIDTLLAPDGILDDLQNSVLFSGILDKLYEMIRDVIVDEIVIDDVPGHGISLDLSACTPLDVIKFFADLPSAVNNIISEFETLDPTDPNALMDLLVQDDLLYRLSKVNGAAIRIEDSETLTDLRNLINSGNPQFSGYDAGELAAMQNVFQPFI